MGKPLVVLADPELNYLAPLACRFLEELGDSVELCVVSDEAYWGEFISQPHDIEVLLLSEAWYGGHLSALNIAHLIVLAEDQREGADRSAMGPVSYTFKYSSPSLLFNRVLRESVALRPQQKARESQVVLCYSPVGGAGTTTIALAMASCLADTYKRVLYVDAEHLQTFTSFMPRAEAAPAELARAMARAGMGAGNALTCVEPYVRSESFDYLPPLRQSLAAYGVDFGFFGRLVEAARASGTYDFIVVDTDNSFAEEKTSLFATADHVVVPVTQDAHALAKVNAFIDNVDGFSADRYHLVCNRYVKGQPNAFEAGAGSRVVLDGYVEFDSSLPGRDARTFCEVPGFKRLIYTLS